VNDDQISVTATWIHVESAASPLNPEVLGAIRQVTAEFWPDVPVIPTMIAGATDGSFLRNAGIPTYGTSGLAGYTDDVRAHGKDERVMVKPFYGGPEYLYRPVKLLASGK
jgi:acetylornithine deacetylase/succinyl-diaminopimelate desuccinylase-like protein